MDKYASFGLPYVMANTSSSIPRGSIKRSSAEVRATILRGLSSFRNLNDLKLQLADHDSDIRYNDIHRLFQLCMGVPFHRAMERLNQERLALTSDTKGS